MSCQSEFNWIVCTEIGPYRPGLPANGVQIPDFVHCSMYNSGSFAREESGHGI